MIYFKKSMNTSLMSLSQQSWLQKLGFNGLFEKACFVKTELDSLNMLPGGFSVSPTLILSVTCLVYPSFWHLTAKHSIPEVYIFADITSLFITQTTSLSLDCAPFLVLHVKNEARILLWRRVQELSDDDIHTQWSLIHL